MCLNMCYMCLMWAFIIYKLNRCLNLVLSLFPDRFIPSNRFTIASGLQGAISLYSPNIS